ncbi:MAG: hypothetical protein HY561_02230 [Gemmatimonadetes bacterium]|nr:hypothetical protein [Gemmatimonadota bacterium]
MRNRKRSRLGLLAAAALGLVACDIPTELPKWNTTWVVEGESTSMAVSSLLPSSVRVATGGGAFELIVGGTSFSRTLGQLCGAPCTAANGQTVPKPAFTGGFSSGISLPSDVVSATLAGGSISVQLTNGFGFDPIRPSASARGFVAVTVSTGGTTLAVDTIKGQTTSFPSNTTLNRTLDLNPANIAGPIQVDVTVSSPAGDPATINTSQSFGVVATPGTLSVSEARVAVASKTVTVTNATLDLDLDATVAEHVKEGAFLLEIDNPFDLTGSFQLTMTPPDHPAIAKSFTVGPGQDTVTITLTPDEMDALLCPPGPGEECGGAREITLAAAGAVTGTGTPPAVTVTPTQVLTIHSKIRFVIGPKEEE